MMTVPLCSKITKALIFVQIQKRDRKFRLDALKFCLNMKNRQKRNTTENATKQYRKNRLSLNHKREFSSKSRAYGKSLKYREYLNTVMEKFFIDKTKNCGYNIKASFDAGWSSW